MTDITATIKTPRLFLRRLTLNDVTQLAMVLSDADSMKHYPHPFSKDEVVDWIRKNMKHYENEGFGLWAVVRKCDNQFLGDCGITLQNIDGEILPEIGFHIIKDYCNMGYATEAAEACKEYALEKLGFEAIYCYSEISNRPSQRVSEKIGMKRIKTFSRDGIEKVVYQYKRQEKNHT
jgi:Acetyltransferases, including N-acetylases of ribosomal proteins